jgi:hypothetical protein
MTTKSEALDLLAIGKGCLGKAADDEVVFTLRSTDQYAPAAIRYWVRCVQGAGGDPRKIAGARRAAEPMEEWQRAHPDQVKVPD